MLKFSTDDLMLVVDKLETLMNIQNQVYETALKQIKMRVSIDLSRDLFKNLIERVSSYVLRKIKKQNRLITKVFKKPNKHSLRSCTKVYETIWGLSCAHTIEARITAIPDRAGTLRLEDVHSHWRFKKPESSLLTLTNDFTSDVVDETLTSTITQWDSEIESELEDLNTLLHSASDHIEPSATVSDSDSDTDLDDLLNVKAPKMIKSKERFKNSINKKNTMTKAEKKAVKSTKRHSSGFELVEQVIETRVKRAKKEQTTTTTIATQRGGARGREERTREGTRGEANRNIKQKPIEISSNSEFSDSEISENGFNNLESSDDEFDVNKNGDAKNNDDWMY